MGGWPVTGDSGPDFSGAEDAGKAPLPGRCVGSAGHVDREPHAVQ